MYTVCTSRGTKVSNIYDDSTIPPDTQFNESINGLDMTTLLMETLGVLEKGGNAIYRLIMTTFPMETLGVLGKGRNAGSPMDGEEAVLLEASGIVPINLFNSMKKTYS